MYDLFAGRSCALLMGTPVHSPRHCATRVIARPSVYLIPPPADCLLFSCFRSTSPKTKKAAKRFHQKILLSLRLKSPNRFRWLVVYFIWLLADFPSCLPRLTAGEN